jgi:hypothetical protein
MIHARSVVVVFMFLIAGDCLAQGMLGHWQENPTASRSWLDGSSSEPQWWARTSSGRLWNVPELPRQLLAIGYGQHWVAWRHTGTADGIWWDDLHVLQWGGSGWWVWPVRFEYRRNGSGVDPWPGALSLAVVPTIETFQGWQISLRIDVASSFQPWSGWGRGDRASLGRRSNRWLVHMSWKDGTEGQPILDSEVGFRFHTAAGIVLGYDASVGEPRLTLLVRRGALLVGSTHAVHPWLGPRHTWEVSLCGGLL